MKVLQLTTHMNIGGIANYIFELSKALKDKGVNTIVASAGGDLEGSLDKTGIPHERIDIKTKFEFSPKVFIAAFAIKRIIQKEGVDMIHAHTRVSQVAGLVASRMTGIPMVTTCHGYFKKRLRFIIDTWGDKVIAISAAVYEHLRNDLGVRDDRIELVYSGVDVDRFSREILESDIAKTKKYLGLTGKVVVGTIGRLSPVKGQKFFIQAMAEVFKASPGAAGLVVGSGPEGPSIKSLATALGIDDRISFIDSVKDMSEALSAIDIFVFPSVKEGLGIALLEALAAAKPCIASRTGGIEDIIKDRENGILTEVGNPHAIAAAILELLSDENLRLNLGRNGRRLVQLRFTLDRMADDVVKVYKKVIKKIVMAGKRILMIEVNWLGDVLFSTPFIRAVRDANPNGYIACLIHPRTSEVLEGNPAIDEMIIYDEEGIHRGVFNKLKLISSLRRKHFDTVYVLHRSFTKALVGYMAGAKERIGYPTKNREMLLTKALEEPDAGAHKVEYFLNLAGESAAMAKERSYEFFIKDADRSYVKNYLSARGIGYDDKFIALCPGGNWAPKRWPKENFAALSDMLAQKYAVKVVITGGVKENELAERIRNIMKSPAVVTCGGTNLKQLGAIFERSCLVVANDTGSMHIAVATGAKVIALFGPTSPEITGPYGRGNYRVIKSRIDCDVPCYDVTCRDNRCMTAINIEEVFAGAADMLDKNLCR